MEEGEVFNVNMTGSFGRSLSLNHEGRASVVNHQIRRSIESETQI